MPAEPSPAKPPPARSSARSLRARVLRTLPTLIAALWVAGIAQFRELGLGPIDYGALLAAAFALQVVLDRAQVRKPPIALPERANPATIALLAAMLTGSLGLCLGGLGEWAVPAPVGRDLPPWPLRTLWHGACAFGASYCRFLSRLLPAAHPRRS